MGSFPSLFYSSFMLLCLQDREGYWKMMHKYIGSDVTSMVTLPVIIFEPMTMIQKMAEVSIIASENVLCLLFDIECSDIWCLLQLLEYSHLLDLADECQDPYMRLVYACKCLYFVR